MKLFIPVFLPEATSKNVRDQLPMAIVITSAEEVS
jgi:hypothetical protein